MTTPDIPSARSFRLDGTTWGLISTLLLAIALLFHSLPSQRLIDLDDGAYVYGNPHITTGLTWENFKWDWTTNSHAGFWIPLTWLSLQLDQTITGPHPMEIVNHKSRLNGAPAPLPDAAVFKIDNLLLHMAAATMLFLFLYRATGRRTLAFVIALLWAIHPLRVESVAWITERKDVLAGLWGFTAMYLYVRWTERQTVLRYFWVCIAFALSLMAKPMFVTLPFLLLVLDAWPLGRLHDPREALRRLLEKWPLLLLAIAGSILAAIAQTEATATTSLAALGIGTRIENALVSYAIYVMRQLRVWDLAVFYPYVWVKPRWELWASSAFLLAITIACLWRAKRRPWLLAGWLWFLGTMIPMIGLMQVGQQAYADRFSYLPTVGLFLMIVFLIDSLRSLSRPLWAVSSILGGAAAVWLGYMTLIQVSYWNSSITLMEHTVAVTNGNYVMCCTLAEGYIREGRYDDAAISYHHAVEINRYCGPAWLALGFLHLQEERLDFAIPELLNAVKISPGAIQPLLLYGVALSRAGKIDESIAVFRKILEINPSVVTAANNLELMLEKKAEQTSTTVTAPASQTSTQPR